MDLSKVPLEKLINEIKRRRTINTEVDKTKISLKTPYNNIFKYDIYEITSVKAISDPIKININKLVGKKHRCAIDDFTGLVIMDVPEFWGFLFYVEGFVVEEKLNYEDYILNLDPSSLIEEDQFYYKNELDKIKKQ